MTVNVREELARESGRYHRQGLMEWWDQKRVAEAKILVIGAGALGNEILKLLALIGVGHIVIFDPDHIEHSNLSRCVLFRESDEGQAKVDVVAKRMRELNPDILVEPRQENVLVTAGLGVFHWADVVIAGVDNREARVFVNAACALTGKTWVDGAIEGLAGVTRVFSPATTACYECTMNSTDHKLLAERRSCALVARDLVARGHVPTSAVAASIIGAFQVQEAIKFLHGQDTLWGEGLHIQGLWNDVSRVTYQRRDDCMGHETAGELSPLGLGIADVTFAELMARAEKELGANSVLELSRDFIVSLSCSHCETEISAGLPVWGASARSILCPDCGEARTARTTASITADDKELLKLTPAQLGVPAFDVLVARCGLESRRGWLFDADAPSALGEVFRAHDSPRTQQRSTS